MDKTPVDARITLIHPRVLVAGDMRLAGVAVDGRQPGPRRAGDGIDMHLVTEAIEHGEDVSPP